MDCIILAAGKGTRMRPLTNDTPKPLLTVNNRPILEWSLLNARPLADHVIVVAKYLKEQIEAYMAQQDIFEHYTIVEQLPKPLGTGHALQVCEPHLKSDDFFVLNGDDIYDHASVKALSQKEWGILTMEKEDQSSWGVVVTDDDGNVTRLHEKPEEGTYPTPVEVSIGGYKFKKSVFDYEIELSSRGEYEITDYIENVAREYSLSTQPCEFWVPIGNREALEYARSLDISHYIPAP